MLVIRWLLSKLTLFIFFIAVGFLVFNWYSKDNSLELSDTSALNNQTVNDKIIFETYKPKVVNSSKEVGNKGNLSNNSEKTDSIAKSKSVKIVKDQKIKKNKELISQKVEKLDNFIKQDINKKEKLIYPAEVHKAKHDSILDSKLDFKQQSPIDELVSLLMSANHLFNSNEKSKKNNQIENKWKLARAYFSSRNYIKAEREYLDLIKLEPEFADFYGELSNLYFVNNEIKKYNKTLTTLTRLYIKNKNINMARHIIRLLQKKSPDLAKMLEQELQQKYSEIILLNN